MGGISVLLLSIPSVIYLHPYLLIDSYFFIVITQNYLLLILLQLWSWEISIWFMYPLDKSCHGWGLVLCDHFILFWPCKLTWVILAAVLESAPGFLEIKIWASGVLPAVRTPLVPAFLSSSERNTAYTHLHLPMCAA